MNRTPSVSVVIDTTGNLSRLPRTLLSLSGQSTTTTEMEILFAYEDTRVLGQLAKMWETILQPQRFVHLPMQDRPSSATLRNEALNAATGRHITVLSSETRLMPGYFSQSLQALRDTDADVVYSNTMTPDGLALLPEYTPNALCRTNVVGPLAMFDRAVLDNGARFRSGTAYMDWDFWIQAAQLGMSFLHLPQPLSGIDVPPADLSARLREKDGRAKAMLVIHNPAYFDEDVVRWALAYLRGEVWVQAHAPGEVPSAVDIRHSINRYTVATMGLKKRSAEVPTPLDRPALARKIFQSA